MNETAGEHAFICRTCGTQYAATTAPPSRCDVCEDDRQYVHRDGPRWTTHVELLRTLHQRVDDDDGLLGVGIREGFAIPQRALVVPTASGNVLWDCVSLVTPDAVDELERRGGVAAIAISHPHFYSSMIEWSDALGGVPVLLHRADERWIRRPSSAIRLWDGDDLELAPDVRLLHLPGHFPGSCGLLAASDDGRRRLLVGDSLYVAADRRHVSVMHSVPNFLPVGPEVIRDLRARLAGIDIDDVYGFAWGGNIIGDARAALEVSFDRYLSAIGADGRDRSAIADGQTSRDEDLVDTGARS